MKVIKYTKLTPELKQEWQQLWQASKFATVSNSPEWFLSGAEAYNKKKKMVVALYDKSNTLIGVGGFVEEKIYGIPTWTSGASVFTDKEAILLNYNSRKEVTYYFSYLKTCGVFYFTSYRKNYLRSLENIKGITSFASDINSFVDFSTGDYGSLPHKKVQLTLNRLLRNTQSFDYNVNVTHNKLNALQTVFAIESKSAKMKNGKGVFDNRQARSFYKKLVEQLPEHVIISLFWLNKLPIAYSICFVNQHILQGSQKAHISDYNYFSPGKLIVFKICDYSREKNLPYFDLGRGVDTFKKSFATRYEPLYSIIISQTFFIAYYLHIMFRARERAYEKLIQMKGLYKLYKSLKKKLTNE